MRALLMIVWATGFAVFLVCLVATILQIRKDNRHDPTDI
jgi:hypothetical protein